MSDGSQVKQIEFKRMDDLSQVSRASLQERKSFFVWAKIALARLLVVLLFFWTCTQRLAGYSFLTHQDMIDIAWQGSIRPLLHARFPAATEEQLREARAYAYGGATIQDMGYYPFGHQLFSNLTHYVRSGAFIDNLFRDSQTVNEYAFAIGALSHYVGDNIGHRYATNPSTAVEFPGLGEKYGPLVTYDEAPDAHIRTEFAYDVEQLSLHRFAPAGYLHSVGFEVPRRLLEQAFSDTYGVSLRSVLGKPQPAIKSYHSSVGKFLPKFASAEALIHRNDFPPEEDIPAFRQFQERQRRAEIENGWQTWNRKPGFQIHMIAFAIRIVPKVGPISALAIRGPSAETNRWYVESVNRATDRYERLLRVEGEHPREALHLPDRDLDTGNRVTPGSYPLTDLTYAKLLQKLTANPDAALSWGLQHNILEYYADPNAPITTKKDPKAWKRVQAELTVLRGMRTVRDEK